MRSLLVTIGVAAAVCGGALAAGWGVQAAVLPAPERSDFVAAHAVQWLLEHRLVESTFTIGSSRPLHGRCLQGWFPTGRNKVGRGTILRLDNGAGVIAVRPHVVELRGPARGERPVIALLQLELAGCPRILAPRIAQHLQDSPHVRVERSFAAGRPALAVHVPTRLVQLVVYIDPATDRPIAVAVRTKRYTGYGEIRLTRLTPEVLRELTRPR